MAYVDAKKLVFPLSLQKVNKEYFFVTLEIKGSKKSKSFFTGLKSSDLY